jgi:hypothetical protein
MKIQIDAREIADLGQLFASAGKQAPKVIARALNHTGAVATTQVKRALVKQVGVKSGAVNAALRQVRATPAELTFELRSSGKHLGLKDFGARQTKRGVSAAPWRQRRVFPRTFMGPGGHVYKRTSKKRLPIEKLWGPSIPKELVRAEAGMSLICWATIENVWIPVPLPPPPTQNCDTTRSFSL